MGIIYSAYHFVANRRVEGTVESAHMRTLEQVINALREDERQKVRKAAGNIGLLVLNNVNGTGEQKRFYVATENGATFKQGEKVELYIPRMFGQSITARVAEKPETYINSKGHRETHIRILPYEWQHAKLR